MPRLTKNFPKLHRHPKGQAFVKLNGKRHWLGPYDDPVTRERYDRLIAEWLENGRELPERASEAEDGPERITLTEVALQYWHHVEKRYTWSKATSIRAAISLPRQLYGTEPAADFGPTRLRVVRDQLIRKNYRRSTINERTRWVRAMFRWAASHELIPEWVPRRLDLVEPLREGEARENKEVGPIPPGDVRRAWPFMSRPVKGLVLLQALTAARPGELVGLRPVDLDTSGGVWSYRPRRHKNASRGKDRVILFGPRAQRVLNAFMRPGVAVDKPLFSPRESLKEHSRKSRHGPGRRPTQPPNPRQTDRKIRDQYDTASYGRAISEACRRAGVPRWSPNRLRHNAATRLRAQFGAEAAQVLLGHSNLSTTEIYAERNERRARDIISQVG